MWLTKKWWFLIVVIPIVGLCIKAGFCNSTVRIKRGVNPGFDRRRIGVNKRF